MVVKTAPIVPGDEERGFRPQGTLGDGRDTRRGPLRPGPDVRLAITRSGMLIECPRGVQPRHRRQRTGSRVRVEVRGIDVPRITGKRLDVLKISLRGIA